MKHRTHFLANIPSQTYLWIFSSYLPASAHSQYICSTVPRTNVYFWDGPISHSLSLILICIKPFFFKFLSYHCWTFWVYDTNAFHDIKCEWPEIITNSLKSSLWKEKETWPVTRERSVLEGLTRWLKIQQCKCAVNRVGKRVHGKILNPVQFWDFFSHSYGHLTSHKFYRWFCRRPLKNWWQQSRKRKMKKKEDKNCRDPLAWPDWYSLKPTLSNLTEVSELSPSHSLMSSNSSDDSGKIEVSW